MRWYKKAQNGPENAEALKQRFPKLVNEIDEWATWASDVPFADYMQANHPGKLSEPSKGVTLVPPGGAPGLDPVDDPELEKKVKTLLERAPTDVPEIG